MSQSSSSACASVSDSEIFRTVRKDSDDRLRNELKRAQDYYSLDFIDSMTRDDLVLAVAKLRKFTNQLVAVKTLTSGFDPSQISMTPLSSVDIAPSSNPSTPGPSSPRQLPSTFPLAADPMASMMTVMLNFMEIQKKADREAAELQKKADPEAADPRTSIHDFIPDCV